MKILTPSFAILSLFVIGGLVFKVSAPMHCGDILPHDNIFVLTGDVRRIPFALKKVREYPDSNLYIIGVGAHAYPTDDTISVKIESDSRSTYQNAIAIRKIVTQENLKRIVIVTTEDHMNRAEYLIKHELPDTPVIACPATLSGMPVPKRVLRWTIEYVKYIVTLFGIKEG